MNSSHLLSHPTMFLWVFQDLCLLIAYFPTFISISNQTPNSIEMETRNSLLLTLKSTKHRGTCAHTHTKLCTCS